MNKDMTTIQQTTPESEWATLREFLRELGEKQAETRQQMKETSQQMKETDRQIQETGRQMKETDRQMKETDRYLKEKFAETDRIVKELAKELGGMSKNNGLIAEEYFYNSFDRGEKNFFGEKFDDIEKNMKGNRLGLKAEYDIVLFNHTSVALIEVKYKAHKNDLPKILESAETFRLLFPYYKDFKIYLGLATMAFYPELEEACEENGIAIIKQLGETVVINDKHLKVY